jgi:4-hydroxyphenylpyruvate 3-dimethylallyltransferase
MTRSVLDVYAEDFSTGAVLWRTTNRPGGALNYRFYARERADKLGAAVDGGLLDPAARLIPLIVSWNDIFGGIPEQSCDFDAARGLTKVWLYLGGTQPLDGILAADGVPESIRRHGPLFHSLDLTHCRHVAVDFEHETVNLYFRAPGPVTARQAERFAGLTGAAMPDEQMLADMGEYMSRGAYTFSVTLAAATGVIQRIGFYALKLPPGRFPAIGDRLARFFGEAPSYDPEEMNAIAWSVGKSQNTYIKAERSYCGDLVPLMRSWNTLFSGEQRKDPALDHS